MSQAPSAADSRRASPGVGAGETALRVAAGTDTVDILPERSENGHAIAYVYRGETGDVQKLELSDRAVLAAFVHPTTAAVPKWTTAAWVRA